MAAIAWEWLIAPPMLPMPLVPRHSGGTRIEPIGLAGGAEAGPGLDRIIRARSRSAAADEGMLIEPLRGFTEYENL